MSIFTAPERAFARALAALTYANPFLPERIECERRVLGARFVERDAPWNPWHGPAGDDPIVRAILEKAEALADRVRARLDSGEGREPIEDEVTLFEDLVLYVLYYRHTEGFGDAFVAAEPEKGPAERGEEVAEYDDFARDARAYLNVTGITFPSLAGLPHVFACYYQVRRAFRHIFYHIIGTSRPTALLRAAVWQSIFSHDLRRYRQVLHRRMADFTTLITGPSGTGKELVARAIGFARYIPFDPKTRAFTEDYFGSFCELNLTALAPTLIESELFGHKRGAFTGAIGDRKGWLETCPPLGTVFLDEIGDLDPAVQVKLLRVIQTRTFQRLGETRDRRFEGKIIAATHRDLAEAIHEGAFREDLYYRLCSDIVEVPGLAARLADDRGELGHLLRFLARREVGDDGDEVAAEVETWIDANLGARYPWPGNVRELEQCLRNVLLRRDYRPRRAARTDAVSQLAEDVAAAALTADELLGRYAALVYRQSGNYEEAARRLGLDRRTVKARIDRDWLAGLDR